MSGKSATITVPEAVAERYRNATDYQKQVALLKFEDLLAMSEDDLFLGGGDIEETFRRMDERFAQPGSTETEDLQKLLERFRDQRRERIEKIGDEAYAAELDALEESAERVW